MNADEDIMDDADPDPDYVDEDEDDDFEFGAYEQIGNDRRDVDRDARNADVSGD